MLKTLRITSLIALIAAVGGVITISVFGLKGNSDILGFLDKPGVVDEAKKKIKPDEESDKDESPLVAQLKAFALRINPPAPPKPKVEKPVVKTETKPKPEMTREKPKSKPVEAPRPKGSVNAKFTLLATVQCPSEPSRSMALLKQSGGKQEWFFQGERVGHLDVQEVRDGSVIFSQAGRNEQELFVPAKPTVKSILKGDNPTISKGGPGSINVQLGDAAGGADVAAGLPGEPGDIQPGQTDSRSGAEVIESGRLRLQRSRSASSDQKPTERIRTRVAPRVRTPQEQKASIENNISSIKEIMERDETTDPEQKRKENESWMKLLQALQSEKETISENTEQPKQPPQEGRKEPPSGQPKPPLRKDPNAD